MFNNEEKNDEEDHPLCGWSVQFAAMLRTLLSVRK